VRKRRRNSHTFILIWLHSFNMIEQQNVEDVFYLSKGNWNWILLVTAIEQEKATNEGLHRIVVWISFHMITCQMQKQNLFVYNLTWLKLFSSVCSNCYFSSKLWQVICVCVEVSLQTNTQGQKVAKQKTKDK
jgi:hypothetical protein